MKFSKLMMGAAAVLLGSACVAGAAMAEEDGTVQAKEYALTVNKSSTGVFPRGVSYEGISLEGKTLEEAKKEINTYVEDRLNRSLRMVIRGESFDYNALSFSASWTNPDAVNELDGLTMSGNLVEQYKKQKDMDMNPVDIDVALTFDEGIVREEVAKYVEHFTQQPVNATVTRVDGQFVVTPEVTGVSYNAEQIDNELITLLSDYSSADPITYEFPGNQTEAQYKSDQLVFSGAPLGSYTTTNLGSGNRYSNIAVSVANMNGHVFYPGETISTLSMYGSVTAEGGYGMAPGYESGKQVDAMGGGICQTTTTLYNAVIRAELQIAYRRNHSMMVTYVPPAMDATVDAASGSDFMFVNSTNYPIYIESYVNGDSITVNIWGNEERPANRSIDFTYEIHSIVWPDPLYVQVVDDAGCVLGNASPSSKYRTEVDPHPALKATSYKLVYVDGVQTEKVKLNSDSYGAMSGILYHASDCSVTPSIVSSSSGVFRYLGATVFLDMVPHYAVPTQAPPETQAPAAE